MKPTICIIALSIFSAYISSAQVVGLNTVVIDPGHGGRDAGAVSKDRKTYEKTLVLDISRRLSDKIKEKYPDINVVLTRSTDDFVTLSDRADKANKIDANLFISIHINSTVKTAPNGFSLHVLGQSRDPGRDLFEYNMNVCKQENSVIQLEDDYSTKYMDFDPEDPESLIFMTLMQNAYLEQSLVFAEIIRKHLRGGPISADRGVWQNPFQVLWNTSMPSVLVELGFISNSDDLAVLRQAENREKLADKICESFCEYKKVYDESLQ